jgi:hypothetical protein
MEIIKFTKKLVKKYLKKAQASLELTAKAKWYFFPQKAHSLMLPDFMCIGAQKAGTSWLWENLHFHEEVYLPENRYIHFFDRNLGRSLESYAKLFNKGEGKVKGEVIPGYGIVSSGRVALIHRIMPDLKIILILRNPIDRAWSHAVMHFTKFKKMKLADVTDEQLIAHFNSDLSRIKGNYLRILSNWKRYYPEKNFLILFNEELSHNPKATLNRVFGHIGVSEEADFTDYPFNERINSGSKKEIPERLRMILTDLYREDILKLSSSYGSYATVWKDELGQ